MLVLVTTVSSVCIQSAFIANPPRQMSKKLGVRVGNGLTVEEVAGFANLRHQRVASPGTLSTLLEVTVVVYTLCDELFEGGLRILP